MFVMSRVRVEFSGNVSMVEFGTVPWWKRLFDLLFILLLSPILIPAMVLLAIYVKVVSSQGPVFFRQERVGLGGRKFLCYKFRSMKPEADTGVHEKYFESLVKSNQPMTKMDERGDPRLIAGGWFLRASGLDELPQVINVFKGEMSLVGPRPCTLQEFKGYADWQKERFNTLPGLTGLWQVSGKNRTTFVRMLELDIEYARTKTTFLDLKIITKTFRVLCDQVIQVGKLEQVPGDTGAAPVKPIELGKTHPGQQPVNGAGQAHVKPSFRGMEPAPTDARQRILGS